MADPNTQIDWWIAQAWQEAQGGAESDALVAWLHENGLTAISSYTILQAALSCQPDEAKAMVFGHPVWAGEDPDSDVANLDYTSDTLEPEPEPDPTFELDNWAEQVEEDEPVYGEEGYQADPAAGAAPPGLSASADPEEGVQVESEPAFEQTDDLDRANQFGHASGLDTEPAQPFELATKPLTAPEIEPAPMDAMPLAAEAAPEPIFEPEMPTPAPADEPELPPSPVMDEPAASMETPPPAVAPPPILRTPPSTPAERAAVFAGVFGKKPAAAKPARPDSGLSASAPEAPPLIPPDAVPPSSDMGPATKAETALAQFETDQPHPPMTTVQMPPPLVYEPLPEIEMPQPVMPAEPLFATAPRDPLPAPPLLSPAETPQAAADTALLEREQPADPDAMNDADGTPRHETGEPALVLDEPEAPPALDEAEFQDVPEPAPNGPDTAAAPEPATEEPSGDLPSSMQAAMEDGETDPPDGMASPRDEEEDELPSIDREQELPPLDDAENEEDEADYSPLPGGLEEGDATENEAGGDETDAPRPRKRTLLDPADEAGDAGYPGGDPGGIPMGDTPEDLAEAARKLGISFREKDPVDIGVDPETVQAAKKLGISFREGAGAAEPDLDETALEAQKLGISFREGGSGMRKPDKPLIVKYLPMILGVICIFFLLLLGATFAGPAIAWLKS
jgi:hypothetical protein